MTQTIQERVENIENKDSEVTRLSREKNELQKKKRRLEDKVEEFDQLTTQIGNILKDYQILHQWQDLADEMSAVYDKSAIEEFKNQVERDLENVTKQEFDDFDETEVKSLRTDFNKHSDTLDDIQTEIQDTVEVKCESLSDELGTKQTVLRIPDIGSDEDERIVGQLKSFVEYHRDGNLNSDAAVRYRELADEYQDIEISFEIVQEEYGISDKTLPELQKLLNNQARTLSQIDEDVLSDLKNLPKFSELLTIQFKENK